MGLFGGYLFLHGLFKARFGYYTWGIYKHLNFIIISFV